uniref:Uncharacterized protein n=1 Tax=Rhizophagus irregularis (strain DAOM 181602 / DAOM 197198 / MUCL 43194) TaxID=747089 RepID=U9TWB8_RHIID
MVTDNENDLSTYQKRAILVDLSGKIQVSSKIQLGLSFYNNVPLPSYFKTNIEQDKGFICVKLTPFGIIINSKFLQFKV